MQEDYSEIALSIVIGTLVLLLLVSFVVLFFFIYRRRYFRYRQEIVEIKTNYENELLKTQLEIREQTLNNISREIHDNIGQMLSLVKLNLNVLHPADDWSEQLRQDTSEQVGRMITELRDISKSLNAYDISEAGLANALQRELTYIGKSGRYKTGMHVSGLEHPLDTQREIILFRIAQEALNNILKHANAARITIHMLYGEEEVRLCIEDDGEGFREEKASTSVIPPGAGLKNMHTRAEMIGVLLSVGPNKPRGTVVLLDIPYNHAPI